MGATPLRARGGASRSGMEPEPGLRLRRAATGESGEPVEISVRGPVDRQARAVERMNNGKIIPAFAPPRKLSLCYPRAERVICAHVCWPAASGTNCNTDDH